MDHPKHYRPAAIPTRRLLAGPGAAGAAPAAPPPPAETQAPFAEITLAPAPAPGSAQAAPSHHPLPAPDEKRALFYEMRNIARNDPTLHISPARAFYHQALFMQGFEDDYTQPEPFSCYFPYYQLMSYGQLRTYFSWRTQVRRGQVAATSTSYAFLYVYELLANAGVSGPQQGLDALMAFWQAYRAHDTALDRYVLQWLKDYHIYYPLAHSFGHFVEAHQLQAHYPTVCGYTSGPQNSFDLFAGISKYKITASAFFSDATAPLLQDCFYFVLARLRQRYGTRKRCFEDLIFYPTHGQTAWEPFGRALFYPHLRQPDRQVALSAREVYSCNNHRWTYKTVILKEHGRQLVGYILKEMEACLRRHTGFKHKLAANPANCDDTILKRLSAAGITLPDFIRQTTAEFYALHTRRVVEVNPENLRQIRQEALSTQTRLLVPEAEAPLKNGPEVLPKAAPEPRPEAPPPALNEPLETGDGWAQLAAALAPVERQAIKTVLAGQSLQAFANGQGMLLEVLVDGINQKAVDCVGDAVMELDGTAELYDDYREKLDEMVNS